jgi:hypothetical protein
MVLVLGLTRRSEGDPTHAEVHMIRRFGMAGIDQRTYVGKRLDGSTEKGTEGVWMFYAKAKAGLGESEINIWRDGSVHESPRHNARSMRDVTYCRVPQF